MFDVQQTALRLAPRPVSREGHRGGKLLLPCLGRRYLLRVVGDSMIVTHIADGNILVAEEEEAPADREVVVTLIRGGE